MIDDYSRGIIWATAYLAKENGKQYIFARNIDKWPIEYLAKKAGVNVYQGKSGKNCAKCRKITEFPKLNEISNKSDFLRGYIEIHGIIDIWKNKKKKEKLRLRIYGNTEIINYINNNLPAENKKVQHIKNIIDKKYIGETEALYYQSQTEIPNILGWLNGTPRNEKVWDKWESLTRQIKKALGN